MISGQDGSFAVLSVNAQGDAGIVFADRKLRSITTFIQGICALDANGLATVIYMRYGIESARKVSPGSWIQPATIIGSNTFGSSYLSSDLAVDASGNSVVAVSIIDATPYFD